MLFMKKILAAAAVSALPFSADGSLAGKNGFGKAGVGKAGVGKADKALGPGKNPRQPRFDCTAYVKINGFEGQALLKNISISGFGMASRTYAAMQVGERYVMQIVPASETGVNPFEVEVEARWVKSEVTQFTVGFQTTNRSADRYLTKYVEYLSQKA
jgi:hypothetical protein